MTDTILEFESMVHDSQRVDLATFPKSVSFFNVDQQGSGPLLVEDQEREFIRRFISVPDLIAFFCSQLRIQEKVCVFDHIQSPFVDGTKKPGDIDLMIVPLDPRLTTAAEVKAVQVRANDLSGEKPGDTVPRFMEEYLTKGVEQANDLFLLGFHRTFLVVFIVVDGRLRASANTILRGPTAWTLGRVLHASTESLNSGIGLVLSLLEQPLGRPIEEQATFGIRVHRKESPREQPAELSEKVARYRMSIRAG